MILKVEPILKAVEKINNPKAKIILFSPSGKQFTQKMARDWARKYDNLIMICGRYEGIDARVKKFLRRKKFPLGRMF